MILVLLARNPTDTVTRGLLPAAHALGLQVRILTDDPQAHREAYRAAGPELDYPAPEIEGCAVHEVRCVLAALAVGPQPTGLISNSDHLQVQTALAADYLGLPGKDWRSAARARDKGLMRAWLARSGFADTPWARIPATSPPAATTPAQALDDALARVPLPAVLKPAEGVASEDVLLVRDPAELAREVHRIRARRPGDLLLEGLIEGPLHTLETLGDGHRLRVWGGYRTTVSAAPHFVEERLTWDPLPPGPVLDGVLARLAALDAGFGACHTEFVITAEGPRIVELNDRLIGDHCDLAMAELLGEPVFADVIRVHLGEPVRCERSPSRPQAPGPERPEHGHVHSVLAERDGVLVAAPGVIERVGPGGTAISYRPLRAVGDRITVTGTNRDYLGQLRVLGPSGAALERATADFLAGESWVIA